MAWLVPKFQCFRILGAAWILCVTCSLPVFCQSQSPHDLNVRLSAGVKLNDDPSISYTTFRPSLVYRYAGDGFRLGSVIGGLYNRVDTNFFLHPAISIITGGDTAITIRGDEPRIDGNTLDDYKFSAHKFSSYLGGMIKFPTPPYWWDVRTYYEGHFFIIYDEATNGRFIPPQSFQEHGPVFQFNFGINSNERPGSAFILDSKLYTAYHWRVNHEPWGSTANLKDSTGRFMGSAGVSIIAPLNSRLNFRARAQGSMISSADRLAAMSDASLYQSAAKIGLGDLRADRAFSADAGNEILLVNDRRLALYPFGHSVIYREITPTTERTDSGFGLGLRLLGEIEKKLEWEVTYGNLYGNRADLEGLHEVHLFFLYRFLP